MNSLFTKHRWMQVVWGILLFVAGAITIIFAINGDENTDVSLVLSIAVAIVLFAYGLVILFSSFLELKDGFFKYELIIGGFIIAIGIVFCLNTDVLKSIIVNTVAISLLVFGVIFGIRAALALIKKKRVWWIWFAVVLATLFIAAGILCLIFKEDLVNVCYFALGGILIIVGVIELYITVKRAIESNNIGIEQKDYSEPKKEKTKKEKNKKDKKNKKSKDFKKDVVADVDATEDVDEEDNDEVLEIEDKDDDDEEPINEVVVAEK